jgi:hypothetical protein
MKKKRKETLCGGVNVQGFKQVEGQQNDASSISVLVINGMTIEMVLLLMIASDGIAHVVEVKGGFLHHKFEHEEKICIKIPFGLEEFYDKGTVLLLKKCVY